MLRAGEQRLKVIVVSIATILFLGGVSLGATRSEYDISLDRGGALAGGGGDGYGGSWYHYEDSNDYVMWFYNEPYDPSRMGVFEVWIYIEALDPDKSCGLQVSYGWSTPEWSALGKNYPPLPQDTGKTTQSSFLQTISLYYEDSMYLGATSSIEPHVTNQVSGNPEWVCIIVKGRNIHAYRWISHDCLADTGGGTDPDGNDTNIQLGACCNQQTGECYEASNCILPGVWLGVGTTCADCKVENFTWDFGDAPSSYPVLQSQNGARHTVKPGIYLGAVVSKEKDGKPSPSATGDDYDDGVEFTSALVTGSSATVRITASVNGVINAWIDFNRDGDWADPGEKILVDEPVVKGTNTVSFSVPASASTGSTFARFRFSTATGLNYTGLASDGEVEDYMVQVTSSGGGGGGGGGTIPPGQYGQQSPLNTYYPKWSRPARTMGSSIQGWPEISLYLNGPILADDWADQDQRPVIGIRWWGCFNQWMQPYPPTDTPSAFHIGIWTDAMGTSYPSTLVWETTCANWSWAFSGYVQDPRGQPSGLAVFEMSSLLSQDKWFYPTPIMGSRYWVSISAMYNGQGTSLHPWGFLTRQRDYGSPAMRIQMVGSVIPGQTGQWPPKVGSLFVNGLPVMYPQNVSWDLSLELISSRPGGGSSGGGGGISGSGDVNGDGKVTIEDIAELINLLLGGEVFK